MGGLKVQNKKSKESPGPKVLVLKTPRMVENVFTKNVTTFNVKASLCQRRSKCIIYKDSTSSWIKIFNLMYNLHSFLVLCCLKKDISFISENLYKILFL